MKNKAKIRKVLSSILIFLLIASMLVPLLAGLFTM